MNRQIKNKIFQALLGAIALLCLGTSAIAASQPKNLVGMYQIEELGFYRDIVRVTYNKGKYFIQEYQSGQWSPANEVYPVSKAEFENLLNKPVHYGFSGLANDSVALFKVPKGWQFGNFKCNTGYWLMTLIGPVELIKK